MTEIGKLMKDIKYVTGLSVDQIGKRIGYSRPHLTRLCYSGKSEKVLNALNEKFSKQLGKKKPPTPEESADELVSLQVIKNLTESNRLLTQAVADLSKKLNAKK